MASPLTSRKPIAIVTLFAWLLILMLLSAAPAPGQTPSFPAPSPEAQSAIFLFREAAGTIEENYASLPDRKKFLAAGIFGLQKSLGKENLQVIQNSPRSFLLRSGENELAVHFGGSRGSELTSFESAYQFAVMNGKTEKKNKPLEIMYQALDGMISALDEFSGFLDPAAFRELQVETSGRFGGIGISVSMRDGYLTIIAPIEDTPGFRAGLLRGDIILAVNVEEIRNITLREAVTRMRGPPDTEVRLLIQRQGWEKPREFRIVRAVIETPSVTSRLLEGSIGYIRISTFHQETTHELDEALERLLKENPRGFILDLRNNPGGLLLQSVRVAERFLPRKSMIVFTKGRHREHVLYFHTEESGRVRRKPLVVLVNGGSASASEIVAGALQDLDRALLIGQKTFGKGSVQTIIPLGHETGIRLTTALYYTPLGRSIHHKGIRPDVVVADSKRPRSASSSAPGDGPPAFGENDPQLDLARMILQKGGGASLEEMRYIARRLIARKPAGEPKEKTREKPAARSGG
ncbi:MAG: S41 family peptidase [bacterium]|nr:S41 family peptidase [bacterium]